MAHIVRGEPLLNLVVPTFDIAMISQPCLEGILVLNLQGISGIVIVKPTDKARPRMRLSERRKGCKQSHSKRDNNSSTCSHALACPEEQNYISLLEHEGRLWVADSTDRRNKLVKSFSWC